ncbi:hypothetical protein RMD16_25755 [Pseudomonas aeruginosa]|jgi:hypothetical protein|uniref:hypothetical protein n=1 Tax=Pseudomonas TaxID=286 RepID=UPI001199B3AF|nr:MULTISPECIES: hypothetical protein [Pseudomonas]MBX9756243.1 hypothetical protein [Pseudomonadaceae bacterium]MDS9486666.1 hypothetical protein [Pseudomonas aeruginosa]MDS9540548.1 hypothetical protein [Pseudomonas aeruginosa]MDS9553593.1 hypothetical protein [Pseudomonas aeruginosa]MDS9559597.1 hypothetical protein [Pseudomonas aeruginosa]
MAELNPDDEHRRECLARHMLRNWTFDEIRDWLKKPKRTEAYREDMRARLNRLKQENRKR